MHFKIGVLRNFAIFIGSLIKKRLQHRCSFFLEPLRWLLLNFLEHIFYKAPLVAASVLSNSLVLFKKTGLINTMLLKNIHLESFFFLSHLLFYFSPVKRREEKSYFRKNAKSYVSCFALILSIKNTVGESSAPSLPQKKKRGPKNLMFRKFYFQA